MTAAFDQVVDSRAAKALSADVHRNHPVAAWVLSCGIGRSPGHIPRASDLWADAVRAGRRNVGGAADATAAGVGALSYSWERASPWRYGRDGTFRSSVLLAPRRL